MQFTIPAAALLAFVSGAFAQTAGFDPITEPARNAILAAGETFTIVWESAPSKYDDETVSIVLLSGETDKTLTAEDKPIASNIKNSEGSFNWEVPADLGDEKVYGLQILLDSDKEIFQYSFPFEIEASEDDDTTSTATTASTTAKPKPTGDHDDDDDEDDEDSTTTAAETTFKSNTTTTAAPPKTTVTTVTTATTGGGDEAEPTTTDDPVTIDPESGASIKGAMGTFALVGALAAAVFGL